MQVARDGAGYVRRQKRFLEDLAGIGWRGLGRSTEAGHQKDRQVRPDRMERCGQLSARLPGHDLVGQYKVEALRIGPEGRQRSRAVVEADRLVAERRHPPLSELHQRLLLAEA